LLAIHCVLSILDALLGLFGLLRGGQWLCRCRSWGIMGRGYSATRPSWLFCCMAQLLCFSFRHTGCRFLPWSQLAQCSFLDAPWRRSRTNSRPSKDVPSTAQAGVCEWLASGPHVNSARPPFPSPPSPASPSGPSVVGLNLQRSAVLRQSSQKASLQINVPVFLPIHQIGSKHRSPPEDRLLLPSISFPFDGTRAIHAGGR
jgi:hypothetical protein